MRALNGKAVWQIAGIELGRHNLATILGLCAASLGLGLASLCLGETPVGLSALRSAITGATLPADQAYALFEVRLPRLILGFLAGWAVALSGAMLQSLARNPLADPGLLGLSQGALVTILALSVFWGPLSPALLSLAGFGGALGVALLILALSGRGRTTGMAIILMGIAIETVLSGFTGMLILYTPPEQSYALAGWMAGSLFNASWQGIATLAPWIALSLLAIIFLGRALALYDLGDHLASALGENVARSRPIILIVAVVLSSSALAAVGPLMFLGVMAPHIAVILSPATGRMRLLLAALVGGVLTVGADLVTRTASANVGLPVGLSLVMIGAPLFIITMRLRQMARSSTT